MTMSMSRNGTANLFMMFASLEGWRHVEVTDRHTAVDYAQILKQLSDKHFPDSKKIVLVQDNLNTHKPESLYETFPAPEALRLVHLAENGDSVPRRGESEMQHVAEIGSLRAAAGESGVDSLCESPSRLEGEGDPCRPPRHHRSSSRLIMNAN